MLKIRLLTDVLRGFSLTVRDHKKIIILFATTKFILDNAGRYRAEDLQWYNITSDKESFEGACRELYNITALDIYISHIVQEFLKDIDERDFHVFVGTVNEYVYDGTALELCKAFRDLSIADRDYRTGVTADSALKLAINLLHIKENSSIVDSFNGESGVLLNVFDSFIEEGKNPQSVEYYGQEMDVDAFEIGQVIAFLLSGSCENIKRGDSLKNPALTEWKELRKFRYALSAPPLAAPMGREMIQDQYSRFLLGEYNRLMQVSAWTYAEHVISTIEDYGKGAVLMAPSALFSSIPSMSMVRRSLVTSDIIEGIIKLPAGILSYTSIPTYWIIINKNKAEARQEKIQFIDLSDKGVEKYRGQKVIPEEVIREIRNIYEGMIENDRSVIISRDKIEEYDYNLDVFEKLKEEEALSSIKNENMIPLKEVATIRRGVQLTKSKLDVLNKEEKKSNYLINLKNVEDGVVKLNESEMIDAESRWVELYQVQEGDILITSKGSLFKIALVDESIKNAILTANLFFIRVNKNKYKPEVLKYYFESEIGQKLIESISKGAIIKSISNRDLEELLVPDLDMKVQEQIAKDIKRNKEEYERAVNEARNRYEEGLQGINLMIGI